MCNLCQCQYLLKYKITNYCNIWQNQHRSFGPIFFFSIMLSFFYLHLMVRWIDQVIFYPMYILDVIPVLIFALYLFES